MFCFRYLKSTKGTSDINNTVNIGRSRTHKVSFFIISLHNLIIFFNVGVYMTQPTQINEVEFVLYIDI